MNFFIKRSFSRLQHFNNLDLLEQALKSSKPTFSIIYFSAKWNPLCVNANQHIQNFAEKQRNWTVVKVDTDSAQGQKIAVNYKIKAEPQYVFCLYGDQVCRHIGLHEQNFQKKIRALERLYSEVSQLGLDWRQYGSAAMQFYHAKIKPQKYLRR